MTQRLSLSVAAAPLFLTALSLAAPAPIQKATPVISAANVDRVRSVAEFEKASARSFRLGPGRGELTFLDGRNGLAIVEAGTFRPLRKIAARPLDFKASKDGRFLAWYEQDGQVFIQNAAGGKPLAFKAGVNLTGLAWSPDGKLLAIGDTINENPKVEGSGETLVRLWDTQGQLVRSLPATKLGFSIPVFSPDGTRWSWDASTGILASSRSPRARRQGVGGQNDGAGHGD
jgi:hypothetical protein